MAISTAQPLHSIAVPHVRDTEYLPESDGEPRAETDPHRDGIIDQLDCLKEKFRNSPNVYVTGNIFLYPPRGKKGGQRTPVAPDIFVVFGVEKKDRRIYDMEKEKKPPDVVIELISESSKYEDTGTKRAIYAALGVREYYIFDPLKEVFPSQLRGFRLKGDEYLPVVGEQLRSELLGLTLVVEKGRLRLYDSQTGEKLRTHEESEADRRAAEAKAAVAEVNAATAEAKAVLAQASAAEEAKARQEAEHSAAEAEAEIARLREQLARLQKKKK
jgi:Uma2 family endonuclease